jgi:hypothetical protein
MVESGENPLMAVLTPEMNALPMAIIEACECLKT